MATNYLSHTEIIEAVRSREIRIAYYAVDKATKISTKRYVKVDASNDDDDIDKKIRDYFLESVQPDSVTIHIGPYASIERVKAKERKHHIETRNGQHILDISAAHRILLGPGEFALVGSNECIALSNGIGASLFANVRNTDVGLSHISTIIDPTWEGKLQIGVTNTTQVSKELEFLDALCIARFHRLTAPVPDDIADKFRKERPHYGLDWWIVERDKGRSFFPLRKEYEENESGDLRNKREMRRLKWIDFLKRAGAVLGATSVLAVLTGLLKGYDFVKTYADIPQKVMNLEDQSRQLKKNADDLDRILKTFHVIQSGSHRIQVGDPDTYMFGVNFDKPLSAPPVLLVGVEGLDSSKYSTTITYNREADAARSIIGARIIGEPARSNAAGKEIIATWLVARRSETAP